MPKILIVEDDPCIVEILSYNLEQEGFDTEFVLDGLEATERAVENLPDLIILDLLLPKIDGLGVCRLLKRNSKTKEIPIIMLTAKGSEEDRIIGLELGAEDYIVKPFSPREVVLRVQATLRRYSHHFAQAENSPIKFDDITIDRLKHRVFKPSEEIYLTATEFKLLALLASSPGRVFNRRVLADAVWGDDPYYYSSGRSMDKHISRLRSKLGTSGKRIETVYRVGYRFKSNSY